MTTPSTPGREAILDRLRRSQGEPGQLFRAAGDGVAKPDVPMTVVHAEGDRPSLAQLFAARLEAVSGSCELLERGDQVVGRLVELIRQWSGNGKGPATAGRESQRAEVLAWSPNQLPIPGLAGHLEESGIMLVTPEDLHTERDRARAAAPLIGLTGVDAAIASTGSVVVASGVGRNRAASLLPLHHLMIVPTRRIYPTFEAWLRMLREGGRLETFLRESAQIVFITGPSKSADIELNLTLGVHGPRVVHALVVDDIR
ncbi:MAG: hypothetical protein GTN62_01735 [Gemmatimonadales bacterium]|nr:hypothetical protein [Gemmatimonadales bacterium]NIN10155.1 hypothetical protein [Gemmatimonadales bacterium]NIN48822.1 hypothetical protein [Gemmatimonadales bacterium]NIP06286.1 hypothetical protein [Gemmatimonadales bacterium]NIQ99263.1 hypothetical protein [Gemmatimonadales bacterium]